MAACGQALWAVHHHTAVHICLRQFTGTLLKAAGPEKASKKYLDWNTGKGAVLPVLVHTGLLLKCVSGVG